MGTQITIASIKQNPTKSIVHTTDNRQFGCWTNTLANLGIEANATYEVDIDNTKFGAIITKAKRVASAPAEEPFVSGTYRQNGHASAPAESHTSKDEEIWTLALLKSSIESGQLKIDDKQQLWTAVRTFRDLRRHTFGFDDKVFTPSQAGQRQVA